MKTLLLTLALAATAAAAAPAVKNPSFELDKFATYPGYAGGGGGHHAGGSAGDPGRRASAQ